MTIKNSIMMKRAMKETEFNCNLVSLAFGCLPLVLLYYMASVVRGLMALTNKQTNNEDNERIAGTAERCPRKKKKS